MMPTRPSNKHCVGDVQLSRLTPESIFDALFVVRFSSPKGYAITASELTYFCYLACLLSVYDGKTADDWGYSFAATKSISPYSSTLADAVNVLTAEQRLEAHSRGFTATERADEDYERYASQSLFESRIRYLRAACNSSLVIPLPAVGPALNQEPNLKGALAISASRELLMDESGPQGLHRYFERLASELPDRRDLFLAAVTWISKLADSTSDERSASGEQSYPVDESDERNTEIND